MKGDVYYKVDERQDVSCLFLCRWTVTYGTSYKNCVYTQERAAGMNGFIPGLQKGNEEQPAPGEEGLFLLLKRECNALRSARYGFLALLKTIEAEAPIVLYLTLSTYLT